MAKFRKKPVVIEAEIFTPHAQIQSEWAHKAVRDGVIYFSDGVAHIKTLEGTMTAQPGDWIIRGVKGELYPCKHDIFEATYESA